MGSAFTTYSNGLARSLTNEVVVIHGDKKISVRAIWDTGATNSCISEEVALQLSLIPTGKITIGTPAGDSIANTHLVNVMLPNKVCVGDLVVTEAKIGSQGIGMLIGMDVIGLGDFSVSNYNGTTVFTFRMPSENVTDYVKQMQVLNLIGPKHGTGKKNKNKAYKMKDRH